MPLPASEFLQIMDMLSGYKDLAALDLCEVAPEWDHSGRTVMLASCGLVHLLSPRLLAISTSGTD